MAQEEIRGCGYRHVGALYLCGEYISVPCDRLPYPLDVCPVCGAGIKVSRGFTKINPLALFGNHQPCVDERHPCWVCDPTDGTGFIMRVGEKYYPTPADFTREALTMGVSKRIPFIPRELELGVTPMFLAHKLAVRVEELEPAQVVQGAVEWLRNSAAAGRIQEPLLPVPKITYKLGIFAAFVPHRVEKLIWDKDATPEKLENLTKRNITPVIIKNGDIDHM